MLFSGLKSLGVPVWLTVGTLVCDIGATRAIETGGAVAVRWEGH